MLQRVFALMIEPCCNYILGCKGIAKFVCNIISAYKHCYPPNTVAKYFVSHMSTEPWSGVEIMYPSRFATIYEFKNYGARNIYNYWVN